MTYRTLDWQIDDRVLTLTLNRPLQLNAFTVEMANELIDAYGRASLDDAVGAIVVTGAGKAFCAGMDLSAEGNVFGLDESMDPGLAEIEARWDDPAIVDGVRDTGGRVSLAVFEGVADTILALPGRGVARIFAQAVAQQLLAYHTALALGCDVDRPRNLAKSVTVE